MSSCDDEGSTRKNKMNKINNDGNNKLAMMTTMATQVTEHKQWKGKWEIVKGHQICYNECHQGPPSNDERWLLQPLYLQFIFLLRPEAIEERLFLSMHPLGVQYMSATKGDTLQEITVCVLDVAHRATYWFTKCWLILTYVATKNIKAYNGWKRFKKWWK